MKISDFSFKTAQPEQRDFTATTGENDTRSLEQRFSEVVRCYPERPAFSDGKGFITFAQLDKFSAKIARFILDLNGSAEMPVAVLCQRNRLFLSAALAILRTGAVYVPLDPSLPLKRRREMLNNCKAPLLLTEASLSADAGRLQCECPHLEHILALDVDLFDEAIEKPGDLMSLELWSHVTSAQADGSWKSLFSGDYLAAESLESMAENLVKKNRTNLNKTSRVLDIGSGAGTVAKAIIGRCGHYTAIDLARHDLDRVEALGQDFSETKIATHQFEAIDIHLLPAENYDLITMNSVIENFPGYNYLRRVLDHAVKLLRRDGVIFLGCVWNLHQKEELRDALHSYGDKHGDWSGLIRLEQGQELFIPKQFFLDWAMNCGFEVELDFSTPEISETELSCFRFDVSIRYKNRVKITPAVATKKTRHALAALTKAQFSVPAIAAKNAAYIIYTSGSSGAPKGVVIEHGNLLHLNDALKETIYQPQWGNDPISIALVASFSFDASIQQIVPALCEGHTLHIVPDQTRRDPQALHNFLEENRIVLCDGTPSLFSLLLDYWSEHNIASSVATFVIGGELLHRGLITQFFALEGHEHHRIFNVYGPTECTVDTTAYLITNTNKNDYDSPPIGKALKNIDISIRDSNGTPFPDNIPGEIWIAGAGVGRGYLHDEELTITRFIQKDNRRWYLSGDVGRRLHGGNISYVNRLDQQVKIRGYRIEPGEVEAVLHQCPLLSDAIVVASDLTASNDLELVAYVVPKGDFDKNTLKTYLFAMLPAHAVPAHFVVMDRLTYTSSGKAERNNLPAPIRQKSAERIKRLLHGSVEQRLAAIWSQLLGTTIDDSLSDFFDLGGHSVMAVRLVSLIEQEFGQRIPLTLLFTAPTIKDLAEVLNDSRENNSSYTPVIPLLTSGSGEPIILFHPVGGNVLCYKPLAQYLAGNHPIYAVEAPGGETDWPELLTVEAMASSYFTAIKEAVGPGPYILIGWSFGGLIAFETARHCLQEGHYVKALVLLDAIADTSIALNFIRRDEADMLTHLLQEQFPVDADKIRLRTGDERLDYLIELGIKHEVLPSGFDRIRMRRLLQTYHINALATSRYKPVRSPLKALLVRPEKLSLSTLNVPDDPLQGWGTILANGVDCQWVKGNHESMLMEHTAPELAMVITTYLQTLEDNVGGENG